jgi:hypothetical protein
MSSAFLIINDWLQVNADGAGCTAVESAWTTYEKAHRELSRVAETYEVYLDLDDDNFVLDNTPAGLEYDEYRIEEWELDNNG